MPFVAYFTVLLWLPLAHTITVLLFNNILEPTLFFILFLVGSFGFFMTWLGLKKEEFTGTLYGFLGGGLIWIGWFEGAWKFFSELFKLDPVKSGNLEILSGELQIIEASSVFFLVMIIFLGLNKDTKCRMFNWIHNNLRLRPGIPTPSYKRQYSRLTAMEMVFVNWFCYIYIIILFDPRIFGPESIFLYIGLFFALVWGLYLLIFKVRHNRRPATAIRYAIPCTCILWINVEALSAANVFKEFWVLPSEFPFMNLFILVFFVLGVFYMSKNKKV